MFDRVARRRLEILGFTGLGMFLVGAGWSAWPDNDAERSIRVQIPRPEAPRRSPRTVLFDTTHWNSHTSSRHLRVFAKMADDDGLDSRENNERFIGQDLSRVRILVIANPLGASGTVKQFLLRFGMERLAPFRANAFDPSEVGAVEAWVRSGGALLLVADRASAESAASLAKVFGIQMNGDSIGRITFTRDNGGLTRHAIISERIRRVASFHGQSIVVPNEANVLLRLAPGSSSTRLAQAAAIEHGSGRVVILADAAMITTGLSVPDNDNPWFALNLLRWLARIG